MNIFKAILRKLRPTEVEIIADNSKDQETAKQLSDLLDYFEESLGDTVKREGNGFIVKAGTKINMGVKFGNGFLINNYQAHLVDEKTNNGVK